MIFLIKLFGFLKQYTIHIIAIVILIFIQVLAFTILFLAVKPGLDAVLLHDDTCDQCCDSKCSAKNIYKELGDKEKQNSKEQKGKACNPFQNCSNCVLYFASAEFYLFSKTKIINAQNFSYETKFNSQFNPDFWQPPKIV